MTLDTPMYLDSTQPLSARVDDLIARLTLEEKVGQLQNSAQVIPRLDTRPTTTGMRRCMGWPATVALPSSTRR